MDKSKLKYVIPVYIIILGLSWMLNVAQVAPKINWVMGIGIPALGILGIIVFRVSKVTVVIGLLLVIESIIVFLKQAGILPAAGGAPMFLVALGSLLLLVQILKLPTWRKE